MAIGETLIHEIGHYFGLSEDEIEEIEERYWRGDDDPDAGRVTAVDERSGRTCFWHWSSRCAWWQVPAAIVGDGGEYLAQALNFAAFNRPSLGRQDHPARSTAASAAGARPRRSGSIEAAEVPGPDRRRDFLHFWFYALLADAADLATEVGRHRSPLRAFTPLNLCCCVLAIRVAMPRIGAAAASCCCSRVRSSGGSTRRTPKSSPCPC